MKSASDYAEILDKSAFGTDNVCVSSKFAREVSKLLLEMDDLVEVMTAYTEWQAAVRSGQPNDCHLADVFYSRLEAAADGYR